VVTLSQLLTPGEITMSESSNNTPGHSAEQAGEFPIESHSLRVTKNLTRDLQGAGKLTVNAITGVTDLVEALHSSISRCGGLLGKAQQPHRTSGVTGLVYQNIRTVTKLIGKGIDLPLEQLTKNLDESPSSPQREAVLAALNGVIGDHLYTEENPLAIAMQLRHQGIPLDEEALQEAIDQSSGRLVLLIHGLCMNDLQWTRQGHNHGEALAADLALSPVYVHYNSGLHISENGRKLADLLEQVSKSSDHLQELNIVAHSMGGLVSRSACHYGMLAEHNWLKQLKKIIFLGTPHHGAPLEKGGNWIDLLLGISPYTEPFARLGKIRSSGVTDLRHGYILDDHWQYHERFDFTTDQRLPVALPAGIKCYSVASTSAVEAGKITDHLIGDGLVTLNSALGIHKKPDLNLEFPADQQWIGRGIHHLDLLNSPEVYKIIRSWLS
jgi:pimeloyl-ACP methyl ester carboxylesterase